MANLEKNHHKLEGLRRANRDDEQHWRDKGWHSIEGGRDPKAPADPRVTRPEGRASIGADYTRSPFDESLVHDEQGRILPNSADVYRGYGEQRPEKNYPHAYDRDELINPNVNPAMEFPREATATFRILAVVLALVVFGLVVAALSWGFLSPVRQSPNSKVQHRIETTIALQQFAGFVSRANERR
jgi:hypothetical protein